jgi:hypothetical protein
MINENAISYGLLNEDEKAALRKTIIEDGYTPEQVKEKLETEFDYMIPSRNCQLCSCC